jgi:gas vesicle protein
MPKTPYSSTRTSAPASAHAEDHDVEDERAGLDDTRPSADLLIAALLGAAVGAGVGLLASRAMADDSSTVDRAVRQFRKGSRRVVRAVPDVGHVASSISEGVSDARRAAERTIEREMRAMKRALRRRRRELGL